MDRRESIEGSEDAWSDISYRAGEVWGEGQRVVVEMHSSVVGRSSGLELKDTTYWAAELRDGLVIRGGIYRDRASAEARLGL